MKKTGKGNAVTSLMEIDDRQLLTAEQEKELGWKIASGDLEARNKLVSHNRRLVYSIARQFAERSHFFEMSDLIQEGSMGLMRAADLFNSDMGFRFSTYAMLWIRQYIGRALDNHGRTIRFPVHTSERHNRILKAIRQITGNSSDLPSAQKIADFLNISPESVRASFEEMNSSIPISLDDPIHDDNGNTHQDLIADKSAPNSLVCIEACEKLEETYREIEHILKKVKQLPGVNSARSVAIFRELHGFRVGGEQKNLAEVGKIFEISRERVRQLQKKVFEKLSHQGIEVDRETLKLYRWRMEELEKLTGKSRELGV